MRVKMKRKPAKNALPAPQVQTGAARALERLEAEEASLFMAYETAKADGDALEIKLARDAWLKTSESLRKFDLLIEAARREAGELVPRKDVETYLSNMGALLHFAFCRIFKGSDREHCWRIVDDAFKTWAAGYDPKRSAPVENVPHWMGRSMFAQHAWRNPADIEKTYRSVQIVLEAAHLHPKDEHAFFQFVTGKRAGLEAEFPPTSTK
jgi:hypothetical protein